MAYYTVKVNIKLQFYIHRKLFKIFPQNVERAAAFFADFSQFVVKLLSESDNKKMKPPATPEVGHYSARFVSSEIAAFK